MKIQNIFLKILLSIFIFSLLTPVVYAGVSFSSISYDDTTADVGTTRSISVTMRTSSSSESVTAADRTLSSSPTGLTTLSSPEKPFTITYSGVTKTFTVRSDTANTYSFYITIVDSSGNSYSSSSDLGSKTLEYVNPSSLTLTSVEYPSGSYNKDSSTTNKFGVVVRIQNSLTSSQTRNLTLYFDTTGFTVSGDPQSASVSLSPGQTEKIWNVTVGTSVSDGTHYAYVRLGDNTAAATYSFTVTSTTTTTTAASAGGGTAGITTTTIPVSETKTISSIVAGSSGTVTLDKSSTLKIQEIKIEVKNAVSNAQITVKESSIPSGASVVIASDIGAVYKYLEITKANVQDVDINKVKIKFKVEKSWLDANKIDSSTIALSRYADNKWNKLATNKLSEDDIYVYYEAESPGLSVFSIYGEKLVPATTTTVPATTTTVPATTTTVPGLPSVISGVSTELLIVVIVIIVVLVLVIWKFFISGKKI